jgi:DNA sulfur modification protein DndD
VRLTSITLVNFRQFKGEQSFDLTPARDKPVTLIFGANGAGKTTLLNAFTWALYGEISDDVEEQHRMINDGVWQATPTGGTVELTVELAFQHQDRAYRLRRSMEIRKESDDQRKRSADPQLWQTMPDGSSEVVAAPQEKIRSILPETISRFFFFNGERIEKLVQKGSYAEVKKDIKGLLDLEQVERALEHLPKVDRRLTTDIKKHGGERAGALQDAIDQLTDGQKDAKEELGILEADLAMLTEERERKIELLRQNESVAAIQGERDRVDAELVDARTQLKAAITDRSVLVATRGFHAFTADLTAHTGRLADALYEKGKLPAPLKRELVEKLLEDKECICGTPLPPGSVPWQHVTKWRELAGLEAVETAWQRLSGQLSELSAARKSLRDDLQVALKRITAQREREERLVGLKSDLDGKVVAGRGEDVQKLEGSRIDLEGRIKKKTEQIGSKRKELEEVAQKIEQKKAERSKAEVTDVLAAKARSRSDLVQSVQRALEEILEIRREDMRSRLDTKLRKVYSQISYKPYVPQLNADFELMLYDYSGGSPLPAPKSTGENQILSLSFVAAVSELAREVRAERRKGGDDADDGDYPIVMDAAFGSLDQNYQRDVSRALARMAPQLVVLVSKSQGLGQVLNELRDSVNHMGVIVAHTTGTSNVNEDIELRGSSYPYIRPAAEANYAELRTIK